MNDYSKDSLSSQREAIQRLLATHPLCHGVGNIKSMCTIAAINFALTDEVTDECPDCMSPVLHLWVIPVQDALPMDRLHSPNWTDTVPMAAGTNDGRDVERLALIMDWMWGTVLPQLQPLADKHGFGEKWIRMCQDRTSEAVFSVTTCDALEGSAVELAEGAARKAAHAAVAAQRAENARRAGAADWVAQAAVAADWVAQTSARAAQDNPAFWEAVDAEGLFRRLCCLPQVAQ